MSDTVITSGEETTSGTAETTAPEQTTGQEPAASETTSDAGREQSTSEDGQPEQGKGRKWSVYDEIKELRAQRREWRQSQQAQEARYNQLVEELRQFREAQNRPDPGKAGQARKNFWEDPDGSIDARLEEKLSRLEESLANRFDSVRQQEAFEAELHQKRSGAVEFIRSQEGYDPQDDEDIAEIIRSIPNGQQMDPQMVAEYAWFKFKQARGIGDRSVARARASSVTGQPPGAGMGKKQYTQAEFDQAVDQAQEMLRRNPNDPKINAYIDELHSAYRDGRVK